MSTGGTGSAIRAGRAFVEMFVDDQQLRRGLDGARQQLEQFSRSVMRLGAQFSMVGAAMAAPILAAAKSFAEAGDAVEKASRRTGMAAESFSALQFAAQQSGTSIEAVEKGILRMQRTITQATDGLASSRHQLAELGLAAEDLAGLSTEEQFLRVAEALSQVQDPAEKAARAMQIFGRSGVELIPLLFQGREGIEAMMAEARRLGVVLSEEDAEAAKELTDAIGRLKMSAESLRNAVAVSVAPMLSELADVITGIVGHVREWARENPQLAQSLLAIGGALAGMGAALVTVGALAKVAAVGLGALTAAPILAGLVAVAAAVGGWEYSMRAATRETAALTREVENQRAAGDRLRAAHMGHLDRLDELASKTSLTNAEQAEAQRLIDTLTDSYGDLGLSINGTTGQLEGMAEAQQKVNQAMRDAALAEITAEVNAISIEMAALHDQTQRRDLSWMFLEGGAAFGVWSDPADAVNARIDALAERDRALRQRADAIRGGDRDALTGGAAPGAGEVDFEDLLYRSNEAAELNRRLERDLHRLKLQGIEDEHGRRMALLMEEYGERRRQAELAGADVALVDAATHEAIAQANAARETELAEERRRQAEETARYEESLGDQVARARAMLIEDQRERQLALLAIEERRERAAAAAAGAELRQVEELFRLRREALEVEGPVAASERIGAVGTFSAAGLFGLTASGPAERMARGIDQVARHTLQIQRNTEQAAAFA